MIVILFNNDDLKGVFSLGAASLKSKTRENFALQMEEWLESQGDNIVSSSDLQDALNRNNSDTRSLIAFMTKFGFSDIIKEGKKYNPFFASEFFTPEGKAYLHIVIAERNCKQNPKAMSFIQNAKQLLVQKLIKQNVSKSESAGFCLSLRLLCKYECILKEEVYYAHALQCKGVEWQSILEKIDENRENGTEYRAYNRTDNQSTSVEECDDFDPGVMKKSNGFQIIGETLNMSGIARVSRNKITRLVSEQCMEDIIGGLNG